MARPAFLNRFTNLPVALDLLLNKKITLLDPGTWEDRNDAYFLERYRDELGYKSVLATCFSRKTETFHHWKVFSAGPAGVCIEFDQTKLLASIPTSPDFEHGGVTYHHIRDLSKAHPAAECWPFRKRKVFADEAEYRIVFNSRVECVKSKAIPIALTSITRITLSPWLPEPLVQPVTRVIQGIKDCGLIKVSPSSLVETRGWRAIVEPSASTRNNRPI